MLASRYRLAFIVFYKFFSLKSAVRANKSIFQMREDRRREIEEHVLKVNQLLRNSGAVLDSDDSHDQTEAFGAWEGLSDKPAAELTCHEEEYIDEDRYTTVTVEPVSVSRDGLSKPQPPSDQVESDENNGKGSDRRSLLGKAEVVAAGKDGKSLGIRKKKTKKFRYESRAEKLLADRKRKR